MMVTSLLCIVGVDKGTQALLRSTLKTLSELYKAQKFNHAEHLVVLSLLISSNQLPVKFGGPLSRCQLTQA